MNFQIKYHCCFFSCCEILARDMILGRKIYHITLHLLYCIYFMSFNNYLLCEPYDEIWLIGVKDYSAFLHTCICICQVTISYYLHSIIKISIIHKINIFVNDPPRFYGHLQRLQVQTSMPEPIQYETFCVKRCKLIWE